MYAFRMMAKGLHEVRVCPLLLFVFVCFVGLSSSADAAEEQTIDAGSLSPAVTFVPYQNLTVKQTHSAVTIEFNCATIDVKNRTAMKTIYWNVHWTIIEILNRRNSTTAATTIVATTSTTTTTITTTTTTPTPTSTPIITTTFIRTVGPGKRKKRRRRRRQRMLDEDVIYAEKDLRFVAVDSEIDKNKILSMSLLLYKEGFDDRDFGSQLFKAAEDARNEGTLERETGMPVVRIYKGLPANRNTETMQNFQASSLIWPIVVLLVILLFVVIGGLIYWRKTTTKKREITKPPEVV